MMIDKTTGTGATAQSVATGQTAASGAGAGAVAFAWLEKVRWDADGLVPVIAQESGSNDVVMFAWMNREALQKTVALRRAVYWSRSRQRLWYKGEESGHVQHVHEIRLDCDEDVVLLKIEQVGGIACHTGRHSCFFQKFEGAAETGDWLSVDPVLKDPEHIYR